MVYANLDGVSDVIEYCWNCWIRNHHGIDLGFRELGSGNLLTLQFVDPRPQRDTRVPSNPHLLLEEEKKYKGC